MPHPGFAGDFGYDSNVFYSPNAIGSGLMRLRAHLDLATLGPQYFENDQSQGVQKSNSGSVVRRNIASI